MKSINIQYIWIKNWRNYNNTEINFNTKYIIHYDNVGELNIEKNKLYEDKFYGRNIDLSVLVGSNGIGKTSLLQFIMAFSKGDNHIQRNIGEFIIIYREYDEKNKEKLEVFYHDDNNSLFNRKCINKLKENGYEPKEMYPVKRKESEKFYTYDVSRRKNIRYIYYSDAFNNTGIEFSGQNVLNPYASILHILDEEQDTKNEYYKYGFLDKYWKQETQKQINFVVRNRKIINDFGIQFPKAITVSINRSNVTNHFLKNNKAYESDIDNYFQLFNDKDSFESKMAKELLYSLSYNDELRDNYSIKSKNKEMFNTSLDCIYRIISELAYGENEEYYSKYIKFLDYYLKNVKKSKMYVHTRYDSYFVFKTENKEDRINLTTFTKFVELYSDLSNKDGFLSFNWNLSSGEACLLNSFSRIYDLLERKEDGTHLLEENSMNIEENAIIMYDEAEMSLHPEWQKKYIKSLLNFINICFNGTHIQLILATHSPIMLSDILKQDVIFFKQDDNGISIVDSNDNHKQTFGTNIFDLYNDTFFLKDGAVGAYADKKIIELIDMIKQNANKNSEKIEKMITLLGDETLKSSINKFYYEKLDKINKLKRLENKKKEIVAEIERIEKEINDKNSK